MTRGRPTFPERLLLLTLVAALAFVLAPGLVSGIVATGAHWCVVIFAASFLLSAFLFPAREPHRDLLPVDDALSDALHRLARGDDGDDVAWALRHFTGDGRRAPMSTGRD